jgi:hypothetical protein
MIGLRNATRLADLFWPRFMEREGAVLLASATVRTPREEFSTMSEFERFYNHLHVLDELEHAIPSIVDPRTGCERPDEMHSDFALAWSLAKRIGTMWLSKLAADLPARRFRVYVTRDDDPIVSFHQLRDSDEPWLSDAEIAGLIREDAIVVLDTAAPSRPLMGGASLGVAG